ncbi:exodeoxyribonuclease VII large subunit [Chachezhania sediminis]|uniref:exodeoxyribonuclease VII large subunit n=1 Tax=Chachezhania sediminis TaxID=2599291 RepID=UPI00131BC726|nr:exodeoxyribonuclease VII large subunit [Chachezhania sediminis]
MNDLIDDPTPGQNLPEFSVSEVSGAIKRTLEDQFGRIRVKGEVGRVFKARSGHLYYDIKDDRNVLSCTTWKGQVSQLSVVPEEGLEVVVTGRLTAYGAQSKYNMNVDEVAVAGQGALMALLEKRRKTLAAEGLFDPDRKQPIPFLPEIIGVVTSPSGAVIRDILHRLRERFPRKVLIWPVAVQGANCAPEVARAIEGFNRLTPGGALPRPDLIIVARGGGSVEDLWGFNEEAVVRAAAGSRIPLISAVGHETDTTLIDHASDLRAPTPTAAAELAVPVRLELIATVDAQGARLTRAVTRGAGLQRQRMEDLSRALPRADSLLDTPRQRLDRAGDGLQVALERFVQRRRLDLSNLSGGLRPSMLTRLVAAEKRSLRQAAAGLDPALARSVRLRRERFDARAARLSPRALQREVKDGTQKLDALSARLSRAGTAQIDMLRKRLAAADRMHETLSYKATLERGYAVVRSGAEVMTTRADAAKETLLEVEFRDGRLTVAPQGDRPAKKTPPKPEPEQGSLF